VEESAGGGVILYIYCDCHIELSHLDNVLLGVCSTNDFGTFILVCASRTGTWVRLFLRFPPFLGMTIHHRVES
jgi:hypothetical protein